MKFMKKGIAFLLALCFTLMFFAPLRTVDASIFDESNLLNEKTASILTITKNPTQPTEADYVVFFRNNTKGVTETSDPENENVEFAYRTLPNGAAQSLYHPETLEFDTQRTTQSRATKSNEEFNVGDKKVFTLKNADGSQTINGILPVEFEVMAVGEHCYVWRPADPSFTYRIETSHAETIRNEFEKNYAPMEEAFGKLNYPESGNGKVNLMVYNILCGYDPENGITNYTGGFFWPNDFHPGYVQGVNYEMNGEAMLHIDTYPQIFNKQGTTAVVEQAYATMVHEFQHLINYSRTVINPNNPSRQMDLWLNECMAMSAEEMIYPGSTLFWRVSDWRNYGQPYWNDGRALNYWVNSSAYNVLGSYAIASLFGQYLKLQTGDYTFFSRVLDYYESGLSPSFENAIENAAIGTVFDGMSAADINVSFRIALNFKSAFGIYGFHDNSSFSNLMPMLCTKQNITLNYNGGAVTIKPTDNIYDPSKYDFSSNIVAYCIKYNNVEMNNLLYGFNGTDWVAINADNGEVVNREAAEFNGKKVITAEIYQNNVYGFTNDKAFIMHHLDMQPVFYDKSIEVYDMSYDYSTNTMYVLGKSGAKYALYSMNLNTCELTLVKNIDSTGTPLSIAFDSNGKLYALTNESNKAILCEINMSTGKATNIGSTELAVTEYSQVLNYDHDNGILYLASGTGEGEGQLAIVNTVDSYAFIIRSNIGEVHGLYSIPTYVDNPSARYLSYKIVNNEATITNCSKSAAGVITIPETIQAYPVTAIASSAFSGCSAVTGVIIPEGVKTIGGSAFASCVGLKSIDIPKSVTALDTSAFADCENLTAINIDKDNTNFSSHSGAVYNKSLSTLLICPPGFAGEFTVAPEANTIGNSAFKNCLKVTKIELSVQTIQDNAFFNCKGLKEVVLNNGLQSIGAAAFRSCSALKSLSIPDSVTAIGTNAFRDCSGLASAILPKNLKIIPDYLFTSCTNLRSVELPEKLEEIGAYAFNKCMSLYNVVIPKNVSVIKNFAFNSCDMLVGAQFLGNAPTSFGSKVFDDCAPSFAIYYSKNTSGWTSPTWNGYKTSTDEMPTYILGDANCDGKVNTGDAIMVLMHATGLTKLQGGDYLAADFNLDGKVNTGDATQILIFCVS